MIKKMVIHNRLDKMLYIFLTFIFFSCHKYNSNYNDYILIINYIESNYNFETEIYKDVWDKKFYIKQNDYKREELLDSELKEKMKQFNIVSVNVIPSDYILLELKSKSYIEKRKFIKKFLSSQVINPEGKLIDKKTYFYKWKPNTY